MLKPDELEPNTVYECVVLSHVEQKLQLRNLVTDEGGHIEPLPPDLYRVLKIGRKIKEKNEPTTTVD